MANEHERCALCGRVIEGSPVVRELNGVEEHFDSQGCARVYEVAQANDMLDQVLADPTSEPALRPAPLQGHERSAHFTVQGMHCPGCAVAAERVLRHQPGVRSAEISFSGQQGRIDYDPDRADLASVLQSLERLGYHASPMASAQSHHVAMSQERTLLQLITAAAFGMQVMLLYLVQLYPLYAAGRFSDPEVRTLQYLVWALATPALFYGGSSFLRGAWGMLRSAHTANMDTLVSLGTLSAYAYSVYVTLTGSGEAYFDSVVMITTFVMLGRYLEAVGGSEARKGIRELLSLQPAKAWRPWNNEWHQVSASALAPGDRILVKPGERVPADTAIEEGHATLDESLVTGESAPVERGPGDSVLAGTVVTDAAIIGRVIRPPAESRLAQIAQLVQRTLAIKPPIQRLADRASAYFAFGIMGAAALTFVGWWLTGHAPARSLLAAVSVLVVACPCALGLATPLALAVVLGRTTRAGVLVRNPVALETAARVQRIVFDKTGTLTEGRLSVTDVAVVPAARIDRSELLSLAAAAEQYSEHPVARAIVAAAPSPPPSAEDPRIVRGMGVSVRTNGAEAGWRVLVGSDRFLGVDSSSDLAQEAEGRKLRGETVVWVGSGDGLKGFIALRDQPNPTAPAALASLRAHGVQPVMLSGDSPGTTRAIAKDLGLEDYEGGCSPTEKAARIAEWQRSGQTVAMVGDGVNDAPALAQADLSITTAGGTDVAGETSDLVLTRPNLAVVPWFVEVSRQTRAVIQQNLGWAFAYNVFAVPLAALGLISPVIAAAAMATSSLLVVGNSLRLRGKADGVAQAGHALGSATA
ncbi:MAG: cation-translocating P-type ATPase [Anaerolineae bacterium]|nr:cation-translocating P-type ATPase [Anaerolineae bacterium]